jgi:H+/Cl- antiporter ClcA
MLLELTNNLALLPLMMLVTLVAKVGAWQHFHTAFPLQSTCLLH